MFKGSEILIFPQFLFAFTGMNSILIWVLRAWAFVVVSSGIVEEDNSQAAGSA
jgi:hypothetical protein